MRALHRFVLLTLPPLLLAACGGGSPTGTLAEDGGRKQALAAPVAAFASLSTADTLFAWAESQYPALFPPGPVTEEVDHEGRRYAVRHYPATGNRLGVVSGGMVYGLGPFTQGELANLGAAETYLCKATSGACGPRLTQALRVRIDAGSLQCEPGSGMPLLTQRRRLTDAGIAVSGSDCGFAAFAVPAVCGASDGRYWMFDIDPADAPRAAALGFVPVDADRYPGKPSALACSY
jgi:hypothetical protein